MINVGLFDFYYYIMLAIAMETINGNHKCVFHDPSTGKFCDLTTSI